MLVEPRLIERIWPQAWNSIKSAVVLEEEADILRDLLAGKRFLAVAGDCVAVFRPCETFIEINYVGGKKVKQAWPELSACFDRAAKETGVTRIVALGREAWAKIATDYKPTKTRMYIKEVK